jgi:hypothetical protein
MDGQPGDAFRVLTNRTFATLTAFLFVDRSRPFRDHFTLPMPAPTLAASSGRAARSPTSIRGPDRRSSMQHAPSDAVEKHKIFQKLQG